MIKIYKAYSRNANAILNRADLPLRASKLKAKITRTVYLHPSTACLLMASSACFGALSFALLSELTLMMLSVDFFFLGANV